MLLISSKVIAAGLATISIAGSGIGIGCIFGCFLLSLAWNPSLKSELFSNALLGFALCEAIALFGLMMALLLLFG